MSEEEHAIDQARIKAGVDRTKRRLAKRDARRLAGKQEPATDPISPEIDRWLRSIEPRQELVVRYAMRARWPRVRASRAFDARVTEIEAELKLDEDRLAMVIREARLVANQIEELIDGKPRRR